MVLLQNQTLLDIMRVNKDSNSVHTSGNETLNLRDFLSDFVCI